VKQCWVSREFIHDLSLNKLSELQISEKIISAKCVLDIPSTGQTGTTMRVIESLSKGTKIVSDSLNIKYEKFYNKNFIYIIDFNNIDMVSLHNFINTSEQVSVRDLNSLENWLFIMFREIVDDVKI
jgi:hypothetical protein